MKRVLSLILVSVMLLATVLTCNIGASAAEVEKKPFYMANWDTVDSDKYPSIYTKAYLWIPPDSPTLNISYSGKNGTGRDIASIAQIMKKDFDEYPDGSNTRVLNTVGLTSFFLARQAEERLFMDDGAAELAEWLDEFLAEYKRIGGKLDGISSDCEFIMGYWSYIQQDAFNAGDQDIYRRIVEHPSYQTKLRPKLEERGFKFYQPLASMPEGLKNIQSEIYGIQLGGANYSESRYIWNTCVREMFNEYEEQALWEPLKKHFPDAFLEEYQGRDSYGWMKELPEAGSPGDPVYKGGNTSKVGNYSNYNTYNYAPNFVVKSENNTSYMHPESFNDAIYENNPFGMFKWEVNTYKNMYAATDTKKIDVLMAYYEYGLNYGKAKDGTSAGTAYHAEGYYHAAMLDAKFSGYINLSETKTQTEYDFSLEIVTEILNELNRVAGYADRKPIETPVNWNDSFLLSGMYANGRNIWRITPDTITGASKKNFLVSNKDGQIVFKNKGQTITFPQGTIIEDSFIPAIGTCGYWVETPADVMPTIQNDADRYEKYPAYYESFNSYATGMEFNFQTAKHTHVWDAWLRDGATATIQADPGNAKDKVLAINGSAFLTNTKVPQYITAGDNYAKQQQWEISFNLSALPTGNAEVLLLNASSDSTNDATDGFRVFDGKLYYGTADDYVAFENVTLAANTEYKLVRTLDFTDPEKFTSCYYIYDADGKLLDKVEDVKITLFSLPMEKIGLSTADFGTNTLYLDDYKLSVLGYTADFEVYDAATGIIVKDPTAARDSDTAYRLSWMNASDSTKRYNVVATYSDGTKEIIETVTMAPGSDAVNTGIVKVDGKSLTLSIEEVAVEGGDPNQGGDSNQGGDTNQGGAIGGLLGGESGDNSVYIPWMIVVIVLSVVLIGAVTFSLIVTAPKKTSPTDEADEPAETETE